MDNWEAHNFGIPAEIVLCEKCKCKIDPRSEFNKCENCWSFEDWLGVEENENIRTDK